jgi:dihydroxyacetone kinase-like protein
VNAQQLRALLDDALTTLEASRDELRDLDAAIGDGDLGITVSSGSFAVRESLRQLEPDADLASVFRTAAKSFAAANPSTMSALVAGALLAAARQVVDRPTMDRESATDVLDAATAAIQSRGGAQLGDKTIVDALVPSLAALRQAGPDAREALTAMADAARLAVTDTAALQSQRGRAAWVGERTVGHADGGATAYLRLLEALLRALPAQLPAELPADS